MEFNRFFQRLSIVLHGGNAAVRDFEPAPDRERCGCNESTVTLVYSVVNTRWAFFTEVRVPIQVESEYLFLDIEVPTMAVPLPLRLCENIYLYAGNCYTCV